MDYINQTISSLNKGIDSIAKYLTENGAAIALLLLIAYFIRSNVTKSATFAQAAGSGHVLAQESSSAHNATSREEELRQVRLRQQEIANERALEAAKARKERENKEKERKNNVAKSASTAGPGDKLGGTMKSSSSSSASTGYNPMQPWTSNTSRYQPARRNVNRG